MGERFVAELGARRLRVCAHGDGRVQCLVCGAVLVEPGELPQLCEHVLYLAAEPDGPEAAHPGEMGRESGVHDLASRPDWVRVALAYEVHPFNGVWRMTVAWPIAAIDGGDVMEGIVEAIARFEERVR